VIEPRPIKILHVITGLSTGGAETMLLKLMQSMDEKRFDNRVVSLTSIGTVGPAIEAAGIRVMALDMRRGIPHPLGLWRLWRTIRREQPDIVQTWMYHADLLGLVAARLAGRAKVIWNLRCSFMGEEYYRGMTGALIRVLARLSSNPTAVIVNSETGRTLHKSRGYGPKRWAMLPNGFDTERFHPDVSARQKIRAEIGAAEATPLIGLVARFDLVKGYDTFLTAAGRLATIDPDVQFVMVGNGFSADNSTLSDIVPTNLQDRLHLLGERGDIPALMAALDIVTCASIGEGFPNVVGEAMACGALCVVTDVGDCRAIVGNDGFVVPPSDAAAMAQTWADVLSLPKKKRRSIAENGRQRIATEYSLGSIVEQYQSLYSELTGFVS